MTDCRLLIDPPGSGAWNMALDEVLWEWCTRTAGCCWRFYRWEEPTVSLGYFQAFEDRWQHPASRSCPIVRRASGGGAIVHDAELTYAMAVPLSHAMAGQRQALYRAVHATLIETLADFGIAASLHGDTPTASASPRPFLCFQRRSPGDVLVGEAKIAGSAQRRNRSAVLQHGSVLWARSPAAPELEGLKETARLAASLDELATRWLERLAQRLDWKWCPESLSLEERDRAAHLAAGKYAADSWTKHRNRLNLRDSL
jgi:lipoate-protein ligase A